MSQVTLTIDPEFSARCRKLKARERSLLESSISQYGCLEPITVWANHEDTILDGHSRYEICQSLKVPYKTRALAFDDRAACLVWIDRNQEARRNESDLERTERIGKQYNELKKPAHRPEKGGQDVHLTPEKTAEAIGLSEDLDEKTVRRAAKFSDGIAAAVEVAGPIGGSRVNEQGYTLSMPAHAFVFCEWRGSRNVFVLGWAVKRELERKPTEPSHVGTWRNIVVDDTELRPFSALLDELAVRKEQRVWR